MKMSPQSSQQHKCHPQNISNTAIKNMPTQAQKRFKPYATVTWLSEILANEKECEYSLWQRTHHQFESKPSTYDPSEHDEMVIKRAEKLQNEGFTVSVENQNSFKYKSPNFDICVAGRPDIIPIKNDWAVVEDIKAGKPRNSHIMQVLLYMAILPFAPETQHLFNGHIPHGRLVYRDQILELPKWYVDQKFRQRLWQLMAMLCNSQPPNPKPSQWECRYCKIPFANCPAKLNQGENTQTILAAVAEK